MKKVRFASPLTTIWEINRYEDRKGTCMEQMAMGQYPFKIKIAEIEKKIGYIFAANHLEMIRERQRKEEQD